MPHITPELSGTYFLDSRGRAACPVAGHGIPTDAALRERQRILTRRDARALGVPFGTTDPRPPTEYDPIDPANPPPGITPPTPPKPTATAEPASTAIVLARDATPPSWELVAPTFEPVTEPAFVEDSTDDVVDGEPVDDARETTPPTAPPATPNPDVTWADGEEDAGPSGPTAEVSPLTVEMCTELYGIALTRVSVALAKKVAGSAPGHIPLQSSERKYLREAMEGVLEETLPSVLREHSAWTNLLMVSAMIAAPRMGGVSLETVGGG